MMWLLGVVIGWGLGDTLGAPGLLGALAGGLAGWLFQHRDDTQALKARMDHIEKRMVALQQALQGLAQGAGAERQAAQPSEPPRPADTPAPQPAPIAAIAPAVSLPAAPVPRPATAQAAAPRPLSAGFEPPEWFARLWRGNPLAKIGIVLLFFGVASGLKLAAEYGLFPVSLRLLIAAILGVGLIAFGFIKVRDTDRPEHRIFGLVSSGGGFAMLYLVGYFMLARYAMLGEQAAFALFALLGVTCILMAARQDGPALAVLGLSGAFLAPVLAGTRADSPSGLFAYFVLLNAFILAVDWFKSWRALNLAGFILTLGVGMAWAMESYEPRHYLVTQCFLVLFLIVYSALPVITALFRAPGLQGWQDGLLLFGTPLVGAFLQAGLMEGQRYGLAWSALIGACGYFGLWALLIRRPEPQSVLLIRSHLGIAIALLTAAIPLAFGAKLTATLWAAEGTAILWYGIRTGRRLPRIAGLGVQLIAGLALAQGWDQLGHELPVVNDAVLAALILAMAGVISARLLRSAGEGMEVAPAVPFIWGLIWWLGTGLSEIHRFAASVDRVPFGLLFVAATVLAVEGLSQQWRWPQTRATAILLLMGMWVSVITFILQDRAPFSGLMIIALPLSLVAHYFLLSRHEQSPPIPMPKIRHVGAWWLILFVLPAEFSWHAARLAPGVDLWPFAAWGWALAAGVALPIAGRARQWPFSSPTAGYLPTAVAGPAVVLTLMIAWANTHLPGTTGALPWLPLLNVFDLTVLAGLGALLMLARTLAQAACRMVSGVTLALGFLSLSALAARIAYHWADIPFEFEAMMRSTVFQALITVFWTITAIGTMILGSRRNHRQIWVSGIGLLAVVGIKLLIRDTAETGTLVWTATLVAVAVLVLVASYFAPVPPKAHGK